MKRLVLIPLLILVVSGCAPEPQAPGPGVMIEGKGGGPRGFAYREIFTDQPVDLVDNVATIHAPATPEAPGPGILIEGKGGTPSGFAYKARFVDQTVALDNGVASISGGGGGKQYWEEASSTTIKPVSQYKEILAPLDWSFILNKPAIPDQAQVLAWAKTCNLTDFQGQLPWARLDKGAATDLTGDWPWARVSGKPAIGAVVVQTRDPAATDDKNALGDLWINSTSKDPFICVSNAAGAAVWTKIAGGGGEQFWFQDPNDPDGIYCDKQTVTALDIYADTLEAVTDVDGVIFPLGRSKVGGQSEGSILYDDRQGSPTEGKFLFGEADIDENVVIDTIPDNLNDLEDVEKYTTPADGATLKWKASEKKWMVSPPATGVEVTFETNWRYQDTVIFVWLVVLTIVALRRRRG